MEYVISLLNLPEAPAARLIVAGRSLLCHVKDHFIPHARNNYHPHILGDRVLGFMSVALVGVKLLTIALLTFGPVLPAFSSAITEPNIIALTNQSRQDYNLSTLAENSLLDQAAQAKADDMLAKGYFAHVTPDGRTPWSFITAAGYNYLMAGENLAVNFSQAEDVEVAWMNSPGHKANILNKNFEDIGIGIAQGTFQGHSAIFVVQEFGVSAEQKVILTNTPTKVLAAAVPPPASGISGVAPAVPPVTAGLPTAAVLPPARGPLLALVPTAPAAVKGLEVKSSPAPLTISDVQTAAQGGQLQITTKISGSPVKVLAYFGDHAVMLSPNADGSWAGAVSLDELAVGNLTAHVTAFDIRGQTADEQLADFSNSTVANYNVVSAAAPAPVKVSWSGQVFDPKTVEGKFYLYFIAGLLASLVLAIGIKRHVQHLNLIVNSSFVIILACLLFMAG